MKQLQEITEEEFALVEQYLNRELSAEENAVFEARLLTDENWRKKTAEVRLINTGIKEAVLQEKLETYHKNIDGSMSADAPPATSTGKIVNISRKWIAAASVLFIIALTVWFTLGKASDNEKLYATYFSPDPGLMTAMGSSDDYKFEKAMVEYKEGNYNKAIEAWEQLLIASPQSDTLNYFLGVAYQAIEKDDKARQLLMKVTSQPTNSFYKDACWYLGLSLLKNGETSKAREWIRTSDYPESKLLLNAINNK